MSSEERADTSARACLEDLTRSVEQLKASSSAEPAAELAGRVAALERLTSEERADTDARARLEDL
eukprot:CAMPEP_0195084826 /NCGR_PEP_ID=MMETSP0448-20130528/25421_1 /TAXON_ID=66468 /ORGANISM="Heterocapsa triquestra, Strain CCMP 448" /LENGTH=64 /DNA_ID=CAMNT_0040118183 /DNA_START=54 /DNA_END=245 /DNA_ORIENTATION=-